MGTRAGQGRDGSVCKVVAGGYFLAGAFFVGTEIVGWIVSSPNLWTIISNV